MEDRRRDQRVATARHAATTGRDTTRNESVEITARVLFLGSLIIGGTIGLTHMGDYAGLGVALGGGIGSIFLTGRADTIHLGRVHGPHAAPIALASILAVFVAIAFLILTPVTMPLAVPVGLAGAATWPLWKRRQRARSGTATQHVPATAEAAQPELSPLQRVTHGKPDDLVGDPERDAVQQVLNNAYSLGYLTQQMWEQRTDQATHSQRCGELIHALYDLLLPNGTSPYRGTP